MTAAPSRHGQTSSTARAAPSGGLPQTVTPLPVHHAADRRDRGLPARLPRRQRWRGSVVTGAVMAAIWAALLGDQPGSWVLGVPAIIGGVVLAARVPGPPPLAADDPALRPQLRGAVAFALWFARESLRGAVDVAWRACQPRPAIAPGFRSYTTALPAGAPRTLFANCITLLPGTLTADIAGARLTIHMLDRTSDLDGDLGALEGRIAAIWGLPTDHHKDHP